MSTATLDDFANALDQARLDAVQNIARARHQVRTQLSGPNSMNNSAVRTKILVAIEAPLLEHVDTISRLTDRWASHSSLDIKRLREMATIHLRSVVEAHTWLANPTLASDGKSVLVSVETAEHLLQPIRQRAEARIRELELGIGLNVAPPAPPQTIYNVINANSITGGIQQGTADSTQQVSVTLTTGEIQTAIERLIAVLETSEQDLASKVAADLETIQAQLKKAEPSIAILQEAGRSVRTVLEGALGGAIGGAATPALIHAMTVFTAALGL